MDCILFSANPKIANMSDAIKHLAEKNEKLYFEVTFPIETERFSFPIAGFIHISGQRVRYVARIEGILPFSIEHYAPRTVGQAVKPDKWLTEWRENVNDIRSRPWKHALVITDIMRFEYDTCSLYFLKGRDRKQVTHPPQKYVKVLPPNGWSGFRSSAKSASL